MEFWHSISNKLLTVILHDDNSCQAMSFTYYCKQLGYVYQKINVKCYRCYSNATDIVLGIGSKTCKDSTVD